MKHVFRASIACWKPRQSLWEFSSTEVKTLNCVSGFHWSALEFSQMFTSVFTRLWRHGKHVLFLELYLIHKLIDLSVVWYLTFTFSLIVVPAEVAELILLDNNITPKYSRNHGVSDATPRWKTILQMNQFTISNKLTVCLLNNKLYYLQLIFESS